MPLDELYVKCRVAGYRAVERALIHGKVRKVFIASDADEAMRREMERLAENKGVVVEWAPDMRVLGRACALCRKTSVAAVLADDDKGLT